MAAERRAADPAAHRQAAKAWRQRNPEKVREFKRERAQTEDGRTEHNRHNATYRQKIRDLTAPLPIEVVRPFLSRILLQLDAEHVRSGVRDAKGKNDGAAVVLGRLTGIPRHRIDDLINRDRLKSVSAEDADKLSLVCDFTLNELYERAEEWALLTGSSWPRGYWRRRHTRRK